MQGPGGYWCGVLTAGGGSDNPAAGQAAWLQLAFERPLKGLPYASYLTFLDMVGPAKLANSQEGFVSTDGLPVSMCQGLIVPLYKGAGDRALVGNERPITIPHHP